MPDDEVRRSLPPSTDDDDTDGRSRLHLKVNASPPVTCTAA
jgi:hypothetical protein